ncbi:Divalent-cation tolerance protein CutA [Candidatus Cyrtobacter comes]|uniref:Divalent-cation tolerance protein CutA n=1 Tax=Candidatus Cyrtobacter comes TaxID=675776 RepID=A0ABU5L7G7_9RICK|nr:divalent-cation tolerance protein CutA [Candidatus Cyrtobacter comes]MDZ5762077.1 Divalent-cation tolerance protein CutA [Candidatus Cyrtobacter comes]
MNAQILYVTVDSELNSERIAREVLESKLAACVNIIRNVQSLYIENGNIKSSVEYILIIKTVVEKKDQIVKKLIELHPYNTPCILSTNSMSCNKKFYDWLMLQCS